MTRILLIRHGETVANVLRRYLGHTDSPLTETGILQERQVLRLLADYPVTAVHTSDLPRAWSLAHKLGLQFGVSPQATPQLREMNFGVFEGMTYEQVLASDPAQAKAWFADSFCTGPAGGETGLQVLTRSKAYLYDVLSSQRTTDDGCIAVVAHGGPLRLLLADSLWQDPRKQWDVRFSHGEAVEWFKGKGSGDDAIRRIHSLRQSSGGADWPPRSECDGTGADAIGQSDKTGGKLGRT